MTDLLLRNARVPGRDAPVDIAVEDGRIVAIGAAGTADDDARETVDSAGDAVIPGLIEPHLHLDKALLDAQEPNVDGTLAGAVTVTRELKRGFTVRPARRRRRRPRPAGRAHRHRRPARPRASPRRDQAWPRRRDHRAHHAGVPLRDDEH